MNNETYTIFGCRDPRCGYRMDRSSMPTLKTHCPICGNAWIANPPPRVRRAAPATLKFPLAVSQSATRGGAL